MGAREAAAWRPVVGELALVYVVGPKDRFDWQPGHIREIKGRRVTVHRIGKLKPNRSTLEMRLRWNLMTCKIRKLRKSVLQRKIPKS